MDIVFAKGRCAVLGYVLVFDEIVVVIVEVIIGWLAHNQY
jgi:hypothetical protein